MYKLLDIEPLFFGEEPAVSILDFDSSRNLLKKAADSRIESFASQIKPESGKIYIHILAMGAGEYYGANRNADYFPEKNLIEYHQTFETSPAHIFKHHINKDPNIAIGKVIFSVYNERMHRVEVIAWVDKEKGKDYVARIESGEFPSTSMACHTPFDTCSICGNKARSRGEYCSHLRTELGRILPDGQRVMAINNGPLRFFDMSFVFKPADVTSSVLQKVAFNSGQGFESYHAMSSTEAAEHEGLTEKAAEIKKLSELIKEVEGQVVASSNSLNELLAKVKDPDDEVLKTLVNLDLHHVIHALAELGMCPSVKFFAKLIGRKIAGENVDEIESLISGLMVHEAENLNVPLISLEKSAENHSSVVLAKTILNQFGKQASLAPNMMIHSLFPDSMDISNVPSNRGFAGNGPQVINNPEHEYLALKNKIINEKPGLLKTLFLVAGAATAAKWLLSKMIESKVKEEIASREAQRNNSAVKIVLVKSANEAYTVTQLLKANLLRDLTQNSTNI